MNRIPVAGDVVSINRKELIAVMSRSDELDVGEQRRVRGYIIDMIKRDDLGKANPKTTTFYIPFEHNEFWSNQVKLTDINFIEQIKLKTEIKYLEK